MSKSMVLPKPWREQPRLGLLVAQVAALAFEALREAQSLRGLFVTRCGLEDHLAGFPIRDLHAVHDPPALVWRHHNAVHQGEQRLVEVNVQQRLRAGELEDAGVLIKAVKAAIAQFREPHFPRFFLALAHRGC
jgi:hypothetical protein